MKMGMSTALIIENKLGQRLSIIPKDDTVAIVLDGIGAHGKDLASFEVGRDDFAEQVASALKAPSVVVEYDEKP